MDRLAAYARTNINVESAIETIGENFKSYLEERCITDLGIKSQRKFQIPISAGKSVSVEEVELYYKNKAEANKKKAKNTAEAPHKKLFKEVVLRTQKMQRRAKKTTAMKQTQKRIKVMKQTCKKIKAMKKTRKKMKPMKQIHPVQKKRKRY